MATQIKNIPLLSNIISKCNTEYTSILSFAHQNAALKNLNSKEIDTIAQNSGIEDAIKTLAFYRVRPQ